MRSELCLLSTPSPPLGVLPPVSRGQFEGIGSYYLSKASYLEHLDLYSGTISFIIFTMAMSSWEWEAERRRSSFWQATS